MSITYEMARQLLSSRVSYALKDERVKAVGFMELYFNNLAYRLWLQDIMKEFMLTVRPGTNKWYLMRSPV